MSARQFDNLRASALWCSACAKAMPVREKLLLVLPDRELYDYLCSACGASIGSREVTATDKVLAERISPRKGRAQVRIL